MEKKRALPWYSDFVGHFWRAYFACGQNPGRADTEKQAALLRDIDSLFRNSSSEEQCIFINYYAGKVSFTELADTLHINDNKIRMIINIAEKKLIRQAGLL